MPPHRQLASLAARRPNRIPLTRLSQPLVIAVPSPYLIPRLAPRVASSPYSSSSSSASKSPSMDSTSAAAEPRFAKGTDEAALAAALTPLLSHWALSADGAAIERSFKFKTFAKTWDFMTAVSLQCKIKNHHPEWSNVYNTTYIRWTTHNPAGLTDKDMTMAAACDALARDFGEVAPTNDDAAATCALKSVADRAVSTAGDCCTPKKATTGEGTGSKI